MELEFKKDFEDARLCWRAYWRGQRLDRPLMYVVAPRSGVEPVNPPAWIEQVRGEIEPLIDRVLAWAASHEFLGDAVPFYGIFFGPDHLAALLGANLTINPNSPNTTWPEHIIKDWDDAEIAVRWDGPWWQRTVECIRAFRRRCDGKVVISMPTLQGGLDCLVALRGVEALLMDLVEAPEKVQAALSAVDAAYDEVLSALAKELDVPRFGGVNRHGLYCHGTCNVPQCDVSCMLGPEMFARFALPSVIHETASLDAAEYHLDGPGAIKHLEALCKVPGLAAIQWQPGAGEAALRDWTDLRLRIDRLGMGQVVIESEHRKIVDLAGRLTAPRTFFYAKADSPAEGQRLLAAVAKAWRR